MKKEYTADQVANWFLSRSSMSPKKLQKMLYYAYSWVLTLTNDSADNLQNRLFNDKFEAWVHGPVIRSIYGEYAPWGYSEIDKKVETPKFDPDIEDILKQVMDVYNKYTADELESITHQEKPWQEARKGLSPLELGKSNLNDKVIFNYYIKRVA